MRTRDPWYWHQARAPFVSVLDDSHTELKVTTETRVASLAAVSLDRFAQKTARPMSTPLRLVGETPYQRYWAGVVEVPTHRLKYRLEMVTRRGVRKQLGPMGASAVPWFEVPYLYPTAGPTWEAGRTIYALFPDRFARTPGMPKDVGFRQRDPGQLYGGTLAGITSHLDYLQQLGVGILYLNPIHPSPSSHRYDVVDYLAVDPRLGTPADFDNLVRESHQRDMKVVLDMVFNHTSAQHPWFRHARRDPRSAYRDWYHFSADQTSYETFATNVPSMPKLNWNPALEAYVADALRHWQAKGVDGFRFDVANEIPPATWRRLRQQFEGDYWIAENWHASTDWLEPNGPFTGVMDYQWYDIVNEAFLKRKISPLEALHRLLQHDQLYTRTQQARNWMLIDSHDTPRALTAAQGHLKRMHMAQVWQWGWAGTPYLYYGDEQQMEGGADPDCRRPFPWSQVAEPGGDRSGPIAHLIRWRRAHPEVSAWPLHRIALSGPVLMAERGAPEESLLLIAHLGKEKDPVAPLPPLPPGRWRSVLSGEIVLPSQQIHPDDADLLIKVDRPG